MLKGLRQSVKRIPGLGSAMHHIYLTLFYQEGRVETIQGGLLKGMKLRRFMHSYWPEYVQGTYEPELQEVFSALIKPGQVVYDVGANVGIMTLAASKLVGPTGLVVAFEPGRKTAEQLRAQIEANGLKNVIVEQYAVSDKVGTSEFLSEETSVMARLATGALKVDESKKTVTVKTTTLDDMIVKHKPPQLVKIDIEGAEILALSGATRLLQEIRPILIVEIHSEELSRGFHTLMGENHYSISLPTGEPAEPGYFSRFVVAKPLLD